jgi:hypothetical protein
VATRGKQFQGFGSQPGLADTSSPQAQRLAATNVANLYDATPDHVKEQGRLWYPKVHEATVKGVKGRGLSVEQGAGIVAAVSPNMDWEKNNIDAFGEISGLKQHHWDAIHASSAASKAARAQGIKRGRSPEAESVLRGMGISRATDSGLIKAHRIMQGEPVDDVLRYQTNPKTNSFAHNIADPSKYGPVTIDGRAHDIATNRQVGWNLDRGINSAGLKRGGTTRYEHFAGAYRSAAEAVGESPHNLQAITWTQGKHMELAVPTKAGTPRKKGATRAGQPYL